MVKRARERGAPALIVVIFSVLLLLTVTTGFMRLIVQDQTRSTDSELSRSAYDAALAGVEDGKRVLKACTDGGSSSAACQAINANACDTVSQARIVSSQANGEVLIRKDSTSNGGGYDQAYTCVKINTETNNYESSIKSDASDVIPLTGTAAFNVIKVSWQKADASGNGVAATGIRTNFDLPPFASWSSGLNVTPPLLRLQYIQHKGSFKMGDYEAATSDTENNSRTLYLFPASSMIPDIKFNYSLNNRVKAHCVRGTCSATIALPSTLKPNPANNDMIGYLRVMPMYGDAKVTVELNSAKFSWVQPSIDATGRAGNVFRRVNVRTKYEPADIQALYPRATVDIRYDLCKSFTVSTDTYTNTSGCAY